MCSSNTKETGKIRTLRGTEQNKRRKRREGALNEQRTTKRYGQTGTSGEQLATKEENNKGGSKPRANYARRGEEQDGRNGNVERKGELGYVGKYYASRPQQQTRANKLAVTREKALVTT